MLWLISSRSVQSLKILVNGISVVTSNLINFKGDIIEKSSLFLRQIFVWVSLIYQSYSTISHCFRIIFECFGISGFSKTFNFKKVIWNLELHLFFYYRYVTAHASLHNVALKNIMKQCFSEWLRSQHARYNLPRVPHMQLTFHKGNLRP